MMLIQFSRLSVFQVLNTYRGLQLRQRYHVFSLRFVQFPLVIEQVYPALEQCQKICLAYPVVYESRLQRLFRLPDYSGAVELHKYFFFAPSEKQYR